MLSRCVGWLLNGIRKAVLENYWKISSRRPKKNNFDIIIIIKEISFVKLFQQKRTLYFKIGHKIRKKFHFHENILSWMYNRFHPWNIFNKKWNEPFAEMEIFLVFHLSDFVMKSGFDGQGLIGLKFMNGCDMFCVVASMAIRINGYIFVENPIGPHLAISNLLDLLGSPQANPP